MIGKVIKYFNLIEIIKRYPIKNKRIHYYLSHTMCEELPVIVKATISSANLYAFLKKEYIYPNDCPGLEFFSNLWTNTVSRKDTSFDVTGFKIFTSLIRKLFMDRLTLLRCNLNDYNLTSLVICDFIKLKHLDLSENIGITDYAFEIFDKCHTLVNLKYFYLNYTSISEKGIYIITHTNQFSLIVELGVRSKLIKKKIDPKWFKNMKKLMSIYISVESYIDFDDDKINEKLVLDNYEYKKKNFTESIIAKK